MRNGRSNSALREVSFELGVNKHAEGSCLVKWGNTHVMCTATVEEKVPPHLRGKHQGWVTAEYGMLPRSTGERMDREAKRGQSGRTQEIQRLIGRSLRAAVDMVELGERTIVVDCDVIQADGGTRCASITGGFLALYMALKKLHDKRFISSLPITEFVAAVSAGINKSGELLLDLDYDEDSNTSTDANFVINSKSGIIEIQGTAEDKPFSAEEFVGLLELAQNGVKELIRLQQKALMGA